MPESPDRAPVVTRAFSIEGVRYEHLVIPGPFGGIPAYLLTPEDAKTRSPAVLALHGHDRQFDLGKSEAVGLVGDAPRSLGMIAARRGCVVLAPDLPGFEENRPSLAERKRNFSLQGEAFERLLGANALVTGGTLQGRISAELSCCVSVLVAHEAVDPDRIFTAGHSFGGQEALWTAVLDPRIAGCLSSCGFSLVRLIVERNISHNMALYVPGLLPDFDFDHLAASIPSKSLCVIAAADDAIYPVEGVRAVEAKVRGVSPPFRKFSFRYLEGPHAFSAEAVGEGLGWLIA